MVPAALTTAWLQFDHTAPNAREAMQAVAEAVVARYGTAAAAAALDYYRRERLAAAVPGHPFLSVAPVAPAGQIDAAVNWALEELLGPNPSPDAFVMAQSKLSGALERLVLDQGRDTILGAITADKEAKGWARVCHPGACSFCLLLATRGAVYHSAATGAFEAHNNCRCHAEPLFGAAYEPTAQVRAAQALYRDTPNGRNAAQARLNFRHAVDDARAAGMPNL